MSPHIGTHIDAPGHIKGDLSDKSELVGSMPLEPLIGEAYVVDLAPCNGAISWTMVENKLSALSSLPSRILFRTQSKIRYEVFEEEYSFFATDLVEELHKRNVKVLGIDAPSADHIRSKTLEAHHELDRYNMIWLENLDLTQVREGRFVLIAFPLKFMELEASPTRAVLLEV
jgi:arylformamidase